MITRQELEGQWNELKGQIRERWGQISDDELQMAKGNTTQLVGLIQQRTGETQRAIEDFLEEAVAGGGTMVQQAVDTARDYAEQARQAAQEQYEQMSANFTAGYESAQQMVRRNPMESVAVAFGAGIITGVIAGLLLKSSR